MRAAAALLEAIRTRRGERRAGEGAMPLVPASSISGRALVTVIAIMTFLAGLTAGAAQLVFSASSEWRSSVATEITIQVRPVTGRNVDQDVNRAAALARATDGVESVRAYSREESERLLEPWLGSGLAFDELPIPRLIVVKLQDGRSADLASLRKALSDQVRNAVLDDHRLWTQRLATMANSVVALALGVLVLVLTATSLTVAFATRGAMAGNRDIIEVLHFVGASDGYIADEFQRHFLRLGLEGGAIGGGAAVLFFVLAQLGAGAWTATPGGDQIEALFGGFVLEGAGYVAVVAVTVCVALLTGLVSRATVRRTLRTIA